MITGHSPTVRHRVSSAENRKTERKNTSRTPYSGSSAVRVAMATRSGKTDNIRKNQFMKENRTTYPIVIESIEGAITFGLNGDVQHLVRRDRGSKDNNKTKT